MILRGKTVTVGVTGGIAAYKACELVSRLRKAGADVHVVMTEHAMQFVAPLTFEALSGNRAVTDMFDRNHDWEIGHISLAKKSDIFVVAPTTANLVGKLAGGIADDFLSTTLMACRCPILLAPAMNTGMMTSVAYTQNERVLRERGIHFVEGDCGRLACGDEGKGRMAEPSKIFDAVVSLLCPKRDYEGKTVLVTAGGTREEIDPVRYIGNRSSGKMGAAIAEAAWRRGARVLYIAAVGAVTPQAEAEIVRVETTEQMHAAVLEAAAQADVIVMAAAPADYAPAVRSAQKIKAGEWTLRLRKNPDIAESVGTRKRADQKLVIFAAETENLLASAREKMKRKHADMAVANDVTAEGAGFDTDTNVATILTASEEIPVPLCTKAALAERILDTLETI